MRKSILSTVIATVALTGFVVFTWTPPAEGQTAYKAKRFVGSTNPDLNGIWQAMNTANWDIQDHSPSQGPMWELGAIGAVPAGRTVVEGNEIPYTPAAAAKKKENFAKRRTDDPEAKCYMPGIPRANYMPYPFQIVQSNRGILFVYEYASANRFVNMGKAQEAGSDTWMGTNNGKWEGDTLVVDVTGLNGLAWFDRAGNFMSDQAHIVERWTPRSAEVLNYEATIEDKGTFTRPWKIRMPLYKHVEDGAQLLEFKCVEFAEELLYGMYKKVPTAPSVQPYSQYKGKQ
jgi:hypothetical protein